ncbi:MAG: U32 family peptidase [Lachnospiraceae bacterium]|nr:U32 family peptidase [Lachnospiraceae bacterium]
MKKPELLAPAGSYQALIGAVNAGADAVYFGADRYSARAFAENFTLDKARDAIRYARLNGVKTRMTVNTLLRPDELSALPAFLAPYAEAGLDGVIIQDFGVLRVIREHFPRLSLHASTQMAVTGVCGARMLKRMGVSRVVPARELSVAELQRIRSGADIEVEAFVHGAMCYSYSGMCLFSAIIGGRSGNRGRCAQACRLPYRTAARPEEDTYCLSMKDLNALHHIPALIEAGVDSFKIEGRMKKAEYAAGVTAIYRKYIDRYLADPASYRVDRDDLERLRGLYQRTEIADGYYTRHNDPSLITFGLPGYAKTDEALLARIGETFLREKRTRAVRISCVLRTGEPVLLTMTDGQTAVCVRGEPVQPAKSRPLTAGDVEAHLLKLGNTPFSAASADVSLPEGEDVFVPVSALNDVRRRACEALEDALLAENKA